MPRTDPGTARPPYARLAAHLTSLRTTARLTQRGVAQAAAVSRGTVQNAESGTRAPSPDVLDALLNACRAGEHDRREAHYLRSHGRATARGRHYPAPAPALINSRGGLADVLADAYEKAGAPSPTAFTRPATGLTRIPRTTLRNIVNRRRLPATEEQLDTFLTVCNVRRSDRAHIHAAWRRIRAWPQPTPPTHRHRVARTTGLDHPRVGTGYRRLLDHLTSDEVETALAFGVAHVTADKAHRNGVTPPPSLDTIAPIAHLLSVVARQHPNPTGSNWLSSVLADATRRTPSRNHTRPPAPHLTSH
ncbi:helix-turn-helix domain-containing protein [Streptomyces sp. NPDC002755]|uniref:helix-turn-helix domain-containing protein n=1 Tax=Streptomyces sp. NPDC002884 TaxID=3154544 RepID=UPI003333B3F0